MIRFQKMVLKNFMSFREKTVVPLSGQKTVRIEGVNEDDPGAVSNMAGKSVIMEALLWCLFGKTLRGLSHDKVVNRKSRRDCSIRLHFSANGISYDVVRYRRHHKFGNKLRISRGENLLHYRHDSDAQKKLETILDCDFQSFVNSTVFGGFDGARKQFALLTDSEQKRVLDSFLRFEKFELALKRTKRVLSNKREKLHSLQLSVEKQKGEVAASKEKLATLHKSAKIFREKEFEERRQLKRELNRLKAPKLTVSKEELEGAERRVQTLTAKLAKSEASRNVARGTLRVLKEKAENKERLVGKPCPACGRNVKAETVEAFLEHLEADKEVALSRLRLEKRKVRKWEANLAFAQKKLKRAREQSELERNKRDKVLAAREELISRLSKTASSAPFTSEIEETSLSYSRKLSRLLVLSHEEKSLSSRIRDLEFWEMGFGNRGIKTIIMREVLPVMNRKLKEYANELFPAGVELEFRASKATKKGADRELFHLHYRSKHGATTYLGESSGGRRRVDICVLLVFSWLSCICNLLFVDELADGLDKSGKEAVFSILERQHRSVFVITHEQSLKSKLRNVWIVRKRNGASKIEMMLS